MKLYIIVLLSLITLQGYSQYPQEGRFNYSPYGYDYPKLDYAMRQLSHHGDATQITYFDMNFVNIRIQDFMEKEMNMAPLEPSVGKSGDVQTFTMKFVKHANMGKVNYLYIKYTMYSEVKDYPLIKSCEVYGNDSYVLEFFTKYWPTRVNVGNKGLAYSILLQDKASINLNLSAHTGNISIINTTIHSLPDYKSKLALAISDQKKANEYAIVSEQKKKDSMKIVNDKFLSEYETQKQEEKAYIASISTGREMAVADNKAKTGNNYNTSDISSIIKEVTEKVIPKDETALGEVEFDIDDKGSLIVKKGNGFVPQSIIDSINKVVSGDKVSPFSYNGSTYASYKKYYVKFVPSTSTKMDFIPINN